MSCIAVLRQSGGSIILSIPKSIAKSIAVEAGSEVALSVEGGELRISPSRRSLAQRLAASPKSPAKWARDEAWLEDGPIGRESL
jgi:antitoxin ChpS